MKLTVALLVVSLALCCSASDDLCPAYIKLVSKLFIASHRDFVESISPFVTNDEMKRAVSQLDGCFVDLPLQHAQALEELTQHAINSHLHYEVLVTLALPCSFATADMSPLVFDIFQKYLTSTHEAFMQTIAPFVTRDIMNTAMYEIKACLLNLPQQDAKAVTEFFINFGEKC